MFIRFMHLYASSYSYRSFTQTLAKLIIQSYGSARIPEIWSLPSSSYLALKELLMVHVLIESCHGCFPTQYSLVFISIHFYLFLFVSIYFYNIYIYILIDL